MFRIINCTKIIAVLSAITLLYNSSGYVLVYQNLIHFTKISILSAIEKEEIDEEIILLSFKKSDIENGKIDFQGKHNREFRYNGGMYDIVERKETGDSIHFYCFYDNKENYLEANFNNHFEKEKEDKKHNSSNKTLLVQQITDQFFFKEKIFYPPESILTNSPYLEKGNSLSEPEVPSPPPKQFCYV